MHFIVEFHLMPILQAVVLYVVTIFSIKHFMKDREPLKLQLPVLVSYFYPEDYKKDTILDLELFDRNFIGIVCSCHDRRIL